MKYMLWDMGQHQGLDDNYRQKLTYFRDHVGFAFFLGPAVFLSILVVNSLRVPAGLVNFWAEDGVIFYSDVINKDFPQRLFTDTGGGGYLNLSGKLIAEFVGLFAIELAPVVNFAVVNLVYSILFMIIYKRLDAYFQNKIYLILFMFFFVFVPIATFDSLATSINLHFFLLFSIFIILSSNSIRPTLTGHLVIFITCLSDPLVVTLVPVILAILFFKKIRSSYFLNFFISLLLQVFAILYFFGDSTRSLGDNPSVTKTVYLFLDRVIGSSFIPKWGFIDGQTLESGQSQQVLIFRFLVGLLVFVLILYLALTSIRISQICKRVGQDFLIGSLLLTSIAYWGVAGLLFNPEPRYAIFPSLCLALIFLMSLDIVSSQFQNESSTKRLVVIVSIIFTLLFASAFQVSEIRVTDQDWKKQIEIGSFACDRDKVEEFIVTVPPIKNDLSLTINCNDLS